VGAIRITDEIVLDERHIEENFIRASGPGGQNVNKVASAVQLRLDMRTLPLPPETMARLAKLAGRRLTREGVLVITAQRHRTQERNRADALARVVDLLRRSAQRPKRRRATKPTAASRERRIAGKKHRGAIKGLRRARPPVE
jgi:ribosome-associated protein